MWYIDGYYSFVNWGFVIYGGIDGFLRLILYFYCFINNRKEIVSYFFFFVIECYYWFLRLWSDYGGENVGVW